MLRLLNSSPGCYTAKINGDFLNGRHKCILSNGDSGHIFRAFSADEKLLADCHGVSMSHATSYKTTPIFDLFLNKAFTPYHIFSFI